MEVTFQRTSGRTGPGAGRPAKLYRQGSQEVAASVPERRYDLAGSLLATAIAESERTGAPIGECLSVTARAAGRVIGGEAVAATGSLTRRADRRQAVLEILARHGYEPELGKRGEIALVNCPFHRLAEEHRTLVCGMNLDSSRVCSTRSAQPAGSTLGLRPSRAIAACASGPPELRRADCHSAGAREVPLTSVTECTDPVAVRPVAVGRGRRPGAFGGRPARMTAAGGRTAPTSGRAIARSPSRSPPIQGRSVLAAGSFGPPSLPPAGGA